MNRFKRLGARLLFILTLSLGVGLALPVTTVPIVHPEISNSSQAQACEKCEFVDEGTAELVEMGILTDEEAADMAAEIKSGIPH